jgi:pilus assembly protein Flp/PilA
MTIPVTSTGVTRRFSKVIPTFNDKYRQEKIKMNTIINKLVNFMKEEEGLTTVEYAVAGTLVALAVVTAFTDLGTAVGDSITAITGVIAP